MADEQAGAGFRFRWPTRATARGRRTEPARVPDWRDTIRRRLVVGAVCCALWTGAIEARLLYLQVYRHEAMVHLAQNQRENTIAPTGRRGDIVDRNGDLLAYTVDADSVIADPTETGNVDTMAARTSGSSSPATELATSRSRGSTGQGPCSRAGRSGSGGR